MEPAGMWPDSAFNRQSGVIGSNLQYFVDQGWIYQHQADAVKALKEELQHQPDGHGHLHNVSLAVLPTGTGKTGVGVLAAYACNARKVLVITPSETISKQQLTQFTYVFDKRLNPLETRPFLEKRGIFKEKSMEMWAPVNSQCALKTSDLNDAIKLKRELVIANAHKFGEGARGVDLEKIDPALFSLVIVDEAHHYPAPTWLRIVHRFQKTRIIFLTATPFHSGDDYILRDKEPCYKLSRKEAVDGGYIRSMEFEEELKDQGSREKNILAVLQRMKRKLQEHDAEDNQYKHKGMILASDTDEARLIVHLWNTSVSYGNCTSFIQGDTSDAVVNFEKPDGTRVLVVIYRLTEGFDCKYVSVVAILRNVQEKSRVYFAQFVGRAVRKLHPNDPVKATVISHAVHKQRKNYNTFEKLADEDPEDLD